MHQKNVRHLLWLVFVFMLQATRALAFDFPRFSDGQVKAWSEERAWQKILLYVNRWSLRSTSVVDDPTFFLAANGATDPAAELRALIDALRNVRQDNPDDDSALCRFPARARFLATHGKFSVDEALGRCPAYSAWLRSIDVSALSVVFSSFYANNPASMFGHTFLRLHRTKSRFGADRNSALLDSAVNFAANPTSKNPIIYSVLGLTGGFPGTFSLMPYYLKVQEYNNAESRDLWEYPVNFSKEEVARLIDILWEVGPHYINYFYLDENCSFILILMLEGAAPRLSLTSTIWIYATPTDTLLAAARSGGILGVPVYRPSAETRLRQRLDLLQSDESAAVWAIVRQNPPFALPPTLMDPVARARVLDAVIEYIEWKENLAGNQTSKKFAALNDWALAERAQTGVTSVAAEHPPKALVAPDEAPLSALWTAKLGYGSSTGFTKGLRLRPALHDFADPDIGYSNRLEIAMFELELRSEEKRSRFFVDHFDLFHAISLAPLNAWNQVLSWRADVHYHRFLTDRGDELRLMSVDVGAGATLALSEGVLAYILAGGTAGWCDARFCVGDWARGGGLMSLGAQDKLSVSLEEALLYLRTANDDGHWQRSWQGRLAAHHLWTRDWQSSVSYEANPQNGIWFLGIGRFL